MLNLEEFVNNHLLLLAAGDAVKLVENDYHDDAVMLLMVGPENQVVAGKAALQSLFGMYLKDIYRGFVSYQKLAFSEDSICLQATINTVAGEARVWDVLYMKDGKIYRHYSGQI
ncbi:MAG: nuclear transport factor 2 family protein [Comamonadaceae bacterium]|nr:nuclear transport factor 2 family protein [Comamonadaceae bacterium]